MSLRHFVRFSDHWFARTARATYYAPQKVSLPAPAFVFKPLLAFYAGARGGVWWLRRVFYAEPLFKAYCTRYGKRLRTDIYLHWVQGKGEIIAGDDVVVDGKVAITFAARYVERPRLVIGSRSGIGHGCSFRIGKEIAIGEHVRIASHCMFFDLPGHPLEPGARMAGEAAPEMDVKPIRIEDNVWIGSHCIVFPGVTIGTNSVVAAGSAVMADVAPNTIVGGNPARRMGAVAAAERQHA